MTAEHVPTTVAELIDALRGLPPGAPVRISDADTGWSLPVHVSFGAHGTSGDADPGTLYLWGDYSEQGE